MKKYLTVLKISLSEGLVYRLNFFLWRVRSVILILTTYFLWDAIFTHRQVLWGYNRSKILTYVFLTLFLRSIVLGNRSIRMASEIADGKLSNFLLKPISYHSYWFTRDLADKGFNLAFICIEVIVLYLLLKPPLLLQNNVLILATFILVIMTVVIINFLLGSITSGFAFWAPEQSWGLWFIFMILQDFLGGVYFPLDILPPPLYHFSMLLPFPYLVYFPINLYLNKFSQSFVFFGFSVLFFWLIVLFFLQRLQWRHGLKIFASEGR